jgi:4-amino-4-deoxy-L-arabinose transferase-like glycosyltransferase
LRRAEHGLLALLLALTAIKGVMWVIAVPLWQGPDENRHFAAVQYIAEHGRLPGPEDVYRDDENVIAGELSDTARLWYAPEGRQAFAEGREGPRESEIAALPRTLRTSHERRALNTANHLSPLTYLLGSTIYRLTYEGSLIARLFAVRLLSVAYATGTVLCAYLIARDVFPGQRAMWWTVPILVSFLPMFSFLGSVVNSDALHVLLYSALLYTTVHTVMCGWNLWMAVVAGAALGLGVLNKPLILGALPVLVLAVAWDAWQRRRWRYALGGLALAGGVALLICGWWLWRSVQLSGALLYANPVRAGVMPVEHPFYDYDLLTYAWHYVLSLMGGVLVTYWADFGWIDTPLAPSIYWLLLAACVLASVGLVVFLARAWRGRDRRQQAAAVTALLLSVLVLVAMIGLNTYRTWIADGIGWGGMQGRYYLGTVTAAMIGLALGLTSVAPARWRPAVHVALRWGMIVLGVISLFGAILPRYYL